MTAAPTARLLEGGHTLAARNGSQTRTYNGRGVADLRALLRDDPAFLAGAQVADVVVGKAAAAILVLGKAREVYAGVISQPALRLLADNGIAATYGQLAPHIANRDNSGWCPLEQLCRDTDDPAQIVALVDQFVARRQRQG